MNTQPAAGDVTPDYARIIQKMGSLNSISTKVNQIADQNSQASQNIIKQIISIREKIETIKALWNEKLKEIDGLQSQHASSIDELRNSHATALENATNQGSASLTELDDLKRAILEADRNYTDQSTSLMTSLENTLMNGDILEQMNELYTEVNALSLAVGSTKLPPLRSGTGATYREETESESGEESSDDDSSQGADISGTPGENQGENQGQDKERKQQEEEKRKANLKPTNTQETIYGNLRKGLNNTATLDTATSFFIKQPNSDEKEKTYEQINGILNTEKEGILTQRQYTDIRNILTNAGYIKQSRRNLKGGSRKKRRRSSKKRHHITRRKHHSKKKHGGRKSLKKHKKDHKKKRPMKRVTFKKHH